MEALNKQLKGVSVETGSNRITFDNHNYPDQILKVGDIVQSEDSPKLKSALKKSSKRQLSDRVEKPFLPLQRQDSKKEEMRRKSQSIKDSSSSRERVKSKKSWISQNNLNSSRSAKHSRENSGKLGSKNNSFFTKDGLNELAKYVALQLPKVKTVKDKQTLRQLLTQGSTPKKIASKKSLKEQDTKHSVISKPTSRRKSSKKEKQILGLMAGIISKKEKDKPKKLNLSKISKEASFKEAKTPKSTKSKRDKSVTRRDKSVPKKGTNKLLIPDTVKNKKGV